MNRLIKFALGLLVARTIAKGKGWLKGGSPLSRGAEAMAKGATRDRPLPKSGEATPEPSSPAKGAGWV